MKTNHKIICLLILILIMQLSPISVLSGLTAEEPLYVEFTTFFGASSNQDGYTMAIDSEGNIFVAGTSAGAKRLVILVKFDPNGNVIFSTTFGGSDHDSPTDLALDSQGNVVIVGITESNDLPTTTDAFNQSYSGPGGYPDDWGCCGDGFIAIFSPDNGSVLYSSYLGGSGTDVDLSVEIDSKDNFYIIGITNSPDFPTTANAYNSTINGGFDVFLSVFSSLNKTLLYSSYFGGSGDEIPKLGVNGKWLSLDSLNNIIFGGYTNSVNYPFTMNAFDTSLSGVDGFVTKFSTKDNQLLFSSLLGGSGYDGIFTVEVDNKDDFYLAGSTDSADFQIQGNPIETEFKGGACLAPSFGAYTGLFQSCGDMFITKVSKEGDLLHSTYLGGDDIDIILDLVTDKNNDVYLSGFSWSENLPTTTSAFQTFQGAYDGYFAKISTNLTEILYATYIGSTGKELLNSPAINSKGDVYLTGFTRSSEFPAVNSQDDYSGGWDLILVKMKNSVSFTSDITTASLTSNNYSQTTSEPNVSPALTVLIMIGGLIAYVYLVKKKKF